MLKNFAFFVFPILFLVTYARLLMTAYIDLPPFLSAMPTIKIQSTTIAQNQVSTIHIFFMDNRYARCTEFFFFFVKVFQKFSCVFQGLLHYTQF